jgi:hypothetical protein
MRRPNTSQVPHLLASHMREDTHRTAFGPAHKCCKLPTHRSGIWCLGWPGVCALMQKPPTTLNTRCQEVQEQPDQTTSKQQPPFSEMSAEAVQRARRAQRLRWPGVCALMQKPPTTLDTRCQEVQEQPDQTTSKQQPPFSEMSTTPFLSPCIKYIRRCWCQCKLPTLVDTTCALNARLWDPRRWTYHEQRLPTIEGAARPNKRTLPNEMPTMPCHCHPHPASSCRQTAIITM